jgi:Tfp pilus assembly protein PilN
MNTLTVMIALWAIAVLAFVCLSIYRAQLSQQETDQLFLSEEQPSFVHQEQDEIIRRVSRIQPLYRGVGGAAALMTFLVIGTWVAQTLSKAQLL